MASKMEEAVARADRASTAFAQEIELVADGLGMAEQASAEQLRSLAAKLRRMVVANYIRAEPKAKAKATPKAKAPAKRKR